MKWSFPFMIMFFITLFTLLNVYGSTSAMDDSPSYSSLSYSNIGKITTGKIAASESSYNTPGYCRELSGFFATCTEDSETRIKLYQYAIKELIEKHNEEKTKSKKQKKQKWIAVIVGAITTVTPLLISIINASNSNECECP